MIIGLLPTLRRLGQSIRWFGLLALTIWISSHVLHINSSGPPGQDVLASLAMTGALSVVIVFGAWFAVRPLRRALLRIACQLMIRSGITFMVCFGVWELLSMAVRIRRFAFPDYSGLATLHRTYDSVAPAKRAKILAVARTLGESPSCDVFKESIMFLDIVGA